MGVPEMDELNFTDSELDYHVRSALIAAVQGDYNFYNQLLGVIHHKERLVAEEVALLVTCLKAIIGAVFCININHHRSLLAAIFGMSLWNYGTDVMDALVELLISLASSSADYVDLCLEMLVLNFMPPSTHASHFLDLLKQPRGLAKKIQVLDRVHSTLKDIANVVPLSPLRLEKIMSDRMPNIHTKEPLQFVVMYVENMLRLQSGPMGDLVGSTILVVLVDRLIELDVDIAWDDILQDDFNKDIFDMELEDLEGHADHVEQDCNEVDMDKCHGEFFKENGVFHMESDKCSHNLLLSEAMIHQNIELTREAFIQNFLRGNLAAEKLDNLMVLTFEHLKSCLENGRLVQVFEILLQSFQTTVLTAYKAKFTQFVMFYACSLDPENCGEMFANALLNIFISSLFREWSLRMSAVAYLASYLARARFVPVSFVAAMLESLVNWCFLYCKNHDGDINPESHKVFYAGCQAIMYVLCFRMRQMVAVPRLKSQLVFMHIKAILEHPLKPLQVCLPSIVEEFQRLVKANHVYSPPQSYVDFGLLELEHSRAFGGMERLDMFFPFDPCLLRKCDRYVRPNYIYWSMVKSTYDEDDRNSTSDDDVAGNGMGNQDDGDDEENSDADEFYCSLDKMSITPRDSSSKFGGRKQKFVQMPSKIRPSTSPESL
ncbi:hypothetical protein OROGR_008365 [Orobanche gracilis]